jgi:hypothetical protein
MSEWSIAAILAAAIEEEKQLTEPQPMRRPLMMSGGGETAAPALVLPQVASADLLLDLQVVGQSFVNNTAATPWVDASGNGRNFTGNRVFHTDANGGYVDGNGSDQYHQGLNFADNLEKFAVFSVITFLDWGGIILAKDEWDAGSNPLDGWDLNHDGSVFTFEAFNESSSAARRSVDWSTVPAIVCAQKTSNAATDFHIYINGTLRDGDAAGSTVTNFSTSEPVRIGVRGGPGGPDTNGYSPHAARAYMIYQITDPVSWPTDRAAITAWLAARYGITL